MQNAAIIFEQEWDVKRELGILGLTTEFVRKVAFAAAAAKAEALPVDPCSAPGTFAYIAGVRTIRLELCPIGWSMSRTGNVESTANFDLGIQLCFQNVDLACDVQSPQAISGKGSGSRSLIHAGLQSELFERPQVGSKDQRGMTPVVWVICVSADARNLRAEVSCPDKFEGNQFEGFSKRIFVVNETFNPLPPIKDDDQDDADDYEVRIAKK